MSEDSPPSLPHIRNTQDLVEWVHSSRFDLEDYSQARSLEETATMTVSHEVAEIPGWLALKLAQVANSAGWHVERYGAYEVVLTQAIHRDS